MLPASGAFLHARLCSRDRALTKPEKGPAPWNLHSSDVNRSEANNAYEICKQWQGLRRKIKQNEEPLERVCTHRGDVVLFYILGARERPSDKFDGCI